MPAAATVAYADRVDHVGALMRRSRGARQLDDHAAAVRLGLFGVDPAAVEVDDPTGDGQAEPGASVVGAERDSSAR